MVAPSSDSDREVLGAKQERGTLPTAYLNN
jgi:hypothetical protein